MKNKMAAIFMGGVLISMTGCTAMTISDSTMKQRTSQTLGVNEQGLKIDERKEGVLRSDYKATSNNSAYSCYMTSFLGLATSDAVCSNYQSNSVTKPKAQVKKETNCNALTKAAGKC